MGTAREPVAVSGVWPAWSASVAREGVFVGSCVLWLVGVRL